MIYINENSELEKIRTLRPNGKEGVMMLKSIYDSIRLTILSTLYLHQPLTTNELLEKCLQKNNNNRNEVSWFILQVKLDLEARELLKSVIPVGQRERMFIKLTRLGRKQLPNELCKNILKEFRMISKADKIKKINSITH